MSRRKRLGPSRGIRLASGAPAADSRPSPSEIEAAAKRCSIDHGESAVHIELVSEEGRGARWIGSWRGAAKT